MKKRSIIALSVVVFGAVVTGGSWYTGKQVEARYGEFIERANRSLKFLNRPYGEFMERVSIGVQSLNRTYGIESELKDVQIERGLFSSDLHYTLEVRNQNETFQFKGRDKVFHGPFPLNRLLKGNLVPVMASLENHISVPAQFKADFIEPELLKGTGAISYAENYSGAFTLTGLKSTSTPLAFSEVNVEFDLDKDGKAKIKSVVPHLEIVLEQSERAVVEQLEYEMSVKSSDQFNALRIDDIRGKAKAVKLISLSNKGNEIVLSDLQLKNESGIQGDNYINTSEIEGKVRVKRQEREADLGQLNASLLLDVDARAASELMAFVNQPQTGSVKDQEILNALFAKPWKLHLNDLKLKNSKGESELSVIINSQGVEPQAGVGLSELLLCFQPSKSSLKVNLAATEELIKQLLLLNPEIKADDAEMMAKERFQNFIIQLHESGIGEVDGKELKVNVELAQGKVKLNGREVAEKEMQGVLFIIILALASMAS